MNETTSPPSVAGGIRILVVDDDPDIARGTAHTLQQAGYGTMAVLNGEEALQTLPIFQPHLVLSDRAMPGMDGLELGRRIKSDPAYADILFILVSGTYTNREEQVDGLDAGADGYITRPIGNRELKARIEAFVRILRLHQALRAKNAQLEEALVRVKQLSGLLPICSGCKKIRDDQGYWSQVEQYIQKHSEARFTHGFCPSCLQKYFPDHSSEEDAKP